MIIIGITGTLGSGKNTVVEYLVSKYGFKHYSGPEWLKEEAARRGMPINRDSQHFIGNELRAKYGAGHLAEMTYQRAKEGGQNAVIESYRAVGEVETMKAKPEPFYLLAVDADPKLRYERILGRGSFKDHVSFEKFIADEEREMNDTTPGGMEIARCMQMADGRVDNNGDIENLYKQIDDFIQPLLK